MDVRDHRALECDIMWLQITEAGSYLPLERRGCRTMRVFVSHAARDVDFARRLIADLREAGAEAQRALT